MKRDDVKNGSPMGLLATFGIVDIDKLINSIKYGSGEEVIDVKYINDEAKKGLIYFDHAGRPLGGVSRDDEKEAKYFIIPIGYRHRDSGNPLYVAFMKYHSNWSYIRCNTVMSLITGFMDHSDINIDRNEVLPNFSGYFQLIGFGYDEVKKFNDLSLNERIVYMQEYEDTGEVQDVPTEEAKAESASNSQDTLELADKVEEESVNTKIIDNSVENSESNVETDDTKPDEDIVSLESSEFLDNEIVTKVYDRLLVKEGWVRRNTNVLKLYIKMYFEKVRLEQLECKESRGNGYIVSSNWEKCLINLGLLDNYGNYIFILNKVNGDSITFDSLEIVEDKSTLLQHGFSMDDIRNMPEPIKFYKDISELVFDVDNCEIDFDNVYRLNHIINERRYRFPAKYKNIPDDIISNMIKSSIQTALKVAKHDHRYIVPIYNFKSSEIQYMIPIFLDHSMNSKPDLVAVIGSNKNGVYSIFTVIYPSQAYINSRLLSVQDTKWLSD